MKKYCFEISEIRKLTTKVIVEAKTSEEAAEVIDDAYRCGDIDFKEAIEEKDVEYNIDLDSCKEDYTFDDVQFSDEGIQYLS